jgi:zinc protease
VIISERHGSENSPMFWLNEELRATAFRVHGYHHTILGDMPDLETITREELFAYYQSYYVPANAIIVAVGAFKIDDMLAKIQHYFEHLPTDAIPQLFVRPEPPQWGERRVVVERPGATAFLSIAHHVPEATHDDWFKIELLDSILTGIGGSIESKTSRLFKSLVKSGIAAGIDAGLSETIDPYLYNITVTINDGHTHDEAEQIVLQEIERMQAEGVTQHELDKAKKQAHASFAYSTESITNQAYWLAQSAVLGDLEWFDGYLQRLDSITVDDVREAAQNYLIPQRRITGWLVPTGTDFDEDEEDYDDEEDDA